MCSWVMEDNVLPQKMSIGIKLKSVMRGTLDILNKANKCQQERSSVEGGGHPECYKCWK